MKREDLLVGTRPAIDGGKIIMSGAEGFDGYEIMEYMGMVWGISVRAKDMGQDCAMGCKHLTGGELSSYTQLGDEARQRAVDRMLQMAARQGANGVINVEFEMVVASQGGASQVAVHGTAVAIKPIIRVKLAIGSRRPKVTGKRSAKRIDRRARTDNPPPSVRNAAPTMKWVAAARSPPVPPPSRALMSAFWVSAKSLPRK